MSDTGANKDRFSGQAVFIDRGDINTDEIIPAKYLTEIAMADMAEHLLEDLKLEGFDLMAPRADEVHVLVTRSNFGCGSSREHAVWALEYNGITVVLAESFARIFRQNMFNRGLLAVELDEEDIQALFDLEASQGKVRIAVDIEAGSLEARAGDQVLSLSFTLNPFDLELVRAGGWLAFADARY